VTLVLRRTSVSRQGGDWNDDDFDVFDGERAVGRIYRMNSPDEIWFWGVSFLPANARATAMRPRSMIHHMESICTVDREHRAADERPLRIKRPEDEIIEGEYPPKAERY
jgi:hypothetical protein